MADGAAAGPVDEIPIPRASVEKTINPDHLPEYKGPVGVVEGSVYVAGNPAPVAMGKNFDKCPAAADVYGHTFREGAPQPDGSRPLADAILAITGYTGFVVTEKHPAKRVTITGCAYDSRTVDMTFGQVLEVKNENRGGQMFMPYLENQYEPAVMVATPGGDAVKLYAKTPGRYRLIDRAGNGWLEADVFVAFQPLHTVSDLKGRYRIEGVPVGKMTLNAWHPAIAHAFNKEVEVRDGVVTTLDVTITNDKAAPQPSSRNLRPLMP